MKITNRKQFLISFAAIVTSTISMQAAVILVDWDFSALENQADGSSAAGTLIDSSLSSATTGLSSSDLIGGSALVWSGGGDTSDGQLNVKLGNAPDASAYIEYTLTAGSKNIVALTGLSASFYRNGGGAPSDYIFDVSIDGAGFVQFGDTMTQPGTGAPYINETVTGNVTGSEIVIRFDNSSGGNGNIHMNDLTAVGTVAWVPEPSSAVLLGVGGLALILHRRK